MPSDAGMSASVNPLESGPPTTMRYPPSLTVVNDDVCEDSEYHDNAERGCTVES
ncbi:hypothetical protein [Natrinema salaciae]|uniref:Uncharacterized protein n=1 Tax=Natrinema salaciae TaxID=1186196 RepID=A0A1H9GME6_9EURY|nr:hypothetical protein [Natrinema salaciae]SEQ51266.1 hypothetical protein SAMN04489841_1933 [Natrinema salaciae]